MRTWDFLDTASLPSMAFDESGSLLSFSSAIGVKSVGVATGKVARVFGKNE